MTRGSLESDLVGGPKGCGPVPLDHPLAAVWARGRQVARSVVPSRGAQLALLTVVLDLSKEPRAGSCQIPPHPE